MPETLQLPTRTVPAHVRLLPSDRPVVFPEDRPYWAEQNRREFERKLAAGVVKRRPAAR